MSKSVGGAFAYFLENNVNLATERTRKARNSRDAVIDKINNLSDFFPLDKSKHLHFGSFARRTKIRPIDDIDIMICLNSNYMSLSNNGGNYSITLKSGASQILYDCSDKTYSWYQDQYKLNSNKVKNKFKSSLYYLHDCRKADLHSNQEAVTLKFSSYEWNFDIVPAIFVTETFGNGYYLIPDGNGHWKKTDPRVDRDKVTNINSKLDGRVLELVRLAKYWAKVNMGGWISSYLLETMVINYCSSQSTLSEYVDWRFESLLGYLKNAVYSNVYDMKGIQGNINNLSYEHKQRFSNIAEQDFKNAQAAKHAEIDLKDQEQAINYWRKVFGTRFPTYD